MYIYAKQRTAGLPLHPLFATFQEDTMTARQKRIWDLLAEHDCLTSQQIAALLHISDRTVRSDIKEINGSTPLRSSAPKRTGILHRRRSA